MQAWAHNAERRAALSACGSRGFEFLAEADEPVCALSSPGRLQQPIEPQSDLFPPPLPQPNCKKRADHDKKPGTAK
jgi:hypothetical protein